MHNIVRITTVFLLVCLASCSTSNYSTNKKITSLNSSSKIDNAYNLKSAKKYLSLAEASNDIILSQYNKLQACSFLIKANELDEARRIVDSVGVLPENTDNFNFKSIIQAQIMSKSDNINGAQTTIDSIWIPQDLPDYLQKMYFETQAQISAKKGNLLESLKLRLFLGNLDLTDREKSENNYQLWKTLYSFTPYELSQTLNDPELPKDLKGWLTMAKLNKQYETDPEQINRALTLWQQEFPEHPAYQEVYGSNYDYVTTAYIPSYPEHIALLLPLSNKSYSSGAKAIRDGFLAKHYQDKEKRSSHTKISFYDTGKISVENAFDQAKADGAEIIVGPLLKEEIQTLVEKRSIDIPVLALNTISIRRVPNNLYQFGLNPEFEAEIIADKALRDGYKYAIAIVPDNDWGERMLIAFKESWNNSGAIVLNSIKFSSTNDLNSKLEYALGIHESSSRINSLKRSGIKVSSSPRRRQDVDMIFVAANPVMARQVKPLLNFHYANNVPVYANSSVYEGFDQPSKDQDLNDIYFCDMPWIIDENIKSRSLYSQVNNLWPVHMKKHPRLVALGVDAYKLSNTLNQLTYKSGTGISGMTGMLFLESNRQISRELMWGRIKDGKLSKTM